MRKVNAAAGPNLFLDSWINLDREDMHSYIEFLRKAVDTSKMPEHQARLAKRLQAGEAVDFRVCDLRRGMPFATGSVDLLYLGQVIEHLNPVYEAPDLLTECHRVLTPGGIVRITTPDLDLILGKYMEGDMMEFASEQPEIYAKVRSKAFRLAFLMFGSLGPKSTSEHYEGHHVCFNKESLAELLIGVGFPTVTFYPPGASGSEVIANECVDTGVSHSLFAEATR